MVYFRSGFTRTAIEIFLELAQSKEAYPAIFFNLAIICDRIAAFGGEAPPELIECNLLSAESRADQKAAEYFKRSVEALHPWHSGLDGALYLWPEDIPPSLGFSVGMMQPTIEDAYRHLYAGVASIRCGEWAEALKHLDVIPSTHPDASNAAANARTAALLGLSREIRSNIALKIDESNYSEAEIQVSKLAAICSELPIEDLLKELFLEELGSIGARIDQAQPIVDFVLLQTFSRAIQNAVVRFTASLPADPVDEEPLKTRPAENPAVYFAGRCAVAVEDLLRSLIGMGQYNAAIQLLAWAEQQWFVAALQAKWSQKIHHARALDYWSRAKDALARKKVASATKLLGTALGAAHDSEDQGLIKVIELELIGLHKPQTPAETIRLIKQTLAEHRYADAAAMCAEAVAKNPHDEELISLLTEALQLLRSDARSLARVSNWGDAAMMIEHYLEYRPEDQDAQSFYLSMVSKRNDRIIENAWNRWQSRESATTAPLADEVNATCDRVLSFDPTHGRALELQREIAAVASRAKAAAAESSAYRLYRDELILFEEAMARRSATDVLHHARKLLALGPDEHHTKHAIERALPLCVSALRSRLETERDTSALEQIEGEVAQLRIIAPNSATVAELLVRG